MIIEKIKRLMLLCGSMFAASLTGTAQSLDKMQWFNEPEQWEIKIIRLLWMLHHTQIIGVSLTTDLR